MLDSYNTVKYNLSRVIFTKQVQHFIEGSIQSELTAVTPIMSSQHQPGGPGYICHILSGTAQGGNYCGLRAVIFT